ncbi:MAG: hypothetical protein JNM56_25115 [Planctomycetia bacterium]|nr:hypothetical protein [Planctomycetia bacterium]
MNCLKERDRQCLANLSDDRDRIVYRVSLELLQSAEVKVSKELQERTDPRMLRPRECFAEAYHYLTWHCRQAGILLVHGTSSLGGGDDHAWVELSDDIVFDGVLQRFYKKSSYYKLTGAQAFDKFTPGAAFIICARLNTPGAPTTLYGGWGHRLQLPVFDPSRPQPIDYPQVEDYLAKAGFGAKPTQSRGMAGAGGKLSRSRKRY